MSGEPVKPKSADQATPQPVRRLVAETRSSASEDIAAFVAKARAMSPHAAGARGRLVFALDATMSRQPTWDMACALQADMFREAAALGSLDIRLVYYRGLNECRASRMDFRQRATGEADGQDRLPRRQYPDRQGAVGSAARSGRLRRARRGVRRRRDGGERRSTLCVKAGELGLLKVPVFMFQEGHDGVAEQAFREIARLTGGAWCRFDPGAAAQLRELLRAAAAYAAGGREALLRLSKAGSGAATLDRADEMIAPPPCEGETGA